MEVMRGMSRKALRGNTISNISAREHTANKVRRTALFPSLRLCSRRRSLRIEIHPMSEWPLLCLPLLSSNSLPAESPPEVRTASRLGGPLVLLPLCWPLLESAAIAVACRAVVKMEKSKVSKSLDTPGSFTTWFNNALKNVCYTIACYTIPCYYCCDRVCRLIPGSQP